MRAKNSRSSTRLLRVLDIQICMSLDRRQMQAACQACSQRSVDPGVVGLVPFESLRHTVSK